MATAMTTETDSDGVYEFTGLRSDTVYVVEAVSEDGLYTGCATCGKICMRTRR